MSGVWPGWQPDVLSVSATIEPEKISSVAFARIATGCSRQWTRSVLVAWPTTCCPSRGRADCIDRTGDSGRCRRQAVRVVHPVALRRVVERGPPLRRAVVGRRVARRGSDRRKPRRRAATGRCGWKSGKTSISCGVPCFVVQSGKGGHNRFQRRCARWMEEKERRARDTRDTRLLNPVPLPACVIVGYPDFPGCCRRRSRAGSPECRRSRRPPRP